MSDEVLIALVIAAALIVIVFMLRQRLHRLSVKFLSFIGVIEAHPQESAPSPAASNIKITGSKLKGKRNRIDVRRGGTEVDDSKLLGEDNEIVVGSDQDR